MKQHMKLIVGLSIMMAFTSLVHAGKSSGGTTSGGTTSTTGGFTFQYNVGSVPNYHAYGVACQIGAVSTKPKGTIVLGNWWVWDLGPVTGVGTVTCPQPITPKGQTPTCLGLLVFADQADVGGQPFLHPSVDVEIYTPKWYNGYASIEVVEPDGSGTQLYWGLPFNPFAWDISSYIWDVPPAPTL